MLSPVIHALAVCAGIGGLELGARRALGGQLRCVGYVERDAYAASILVARMEDARLDPAPVWDDLSTFPCDLYRGRVDLVTAGFPCPPYSVAGERRGADDERDLWPDVWRIVREVGAWALVVENVRGAVSHRDGLERWLADLAGAGWDASWTVVRASDAGAPHRRERLFVLAWLADASDGQLPLAWRGSEGRAGSRSAGALVAHAIEHGLEGRERAELDGAREGRGGRDAEALGPSDGMADADGRRREGERLTEHADERSARGSLALGRGDHGRLGWPPAPGDADGWRAYLAAGGAPPSIRRGTYGTAHRLDRLRCLGNAVVPQQAELALRLLLKSID